MFRQGFDGGVVDATPAIALNTTPGFLTQGNTGLNGAGNDVESRSPLTVPSLRSSAPRSVLTLGAWYKVPDNMFRLVRDNFIPGVITGVIRWDLPNGSSIIFTDTSEVKYSLPFWTTFPFEREIEIDQVSVRVSSKSIPGLVAMGILTQREADALLGRVGEPEPENNSVADTVQGVASAAKTGFASLAIIALVVAAFYFIPRTGGS